MAPLSLPDKQAGIRPLAKDERVQVPDGVDFSTHHYPGYQSPIRTSAGLSGHPNLTDCNCFDEIVAEGHRGETSDPREAWEDVSWGFGYGQPLIEVLEENDSSDEDDESSMTADDEGPSQSIPKAVFACNDIGYR